MGPDQFDPAPGKLLAMTIGVVRSVGDQTFWRRGTTSPVAWWHNGVVERRLRNHKGRDRHFGPLLSMQQIDDQYETASLHQPPIWERIGSAGAPRSAAFYRDLPRSQIATNL